MRLKTLNAREGVIHRFHIRVSCVFHSVHRFLKHFRPAPGAPNRARKHHCGLPACDLVKEADQSGGACQAPGLTRVESVHIIAWLCPRTEGQPKEEQ